MDNTEPETIVEIELSKTAIAELSNENSRLEKFIDRILGKLASVITLSSIITFLSVDFLPGNEHNFLKYYLTWIMPFLILAIGLWVFTLKKSKSITMKGITITYSTDPKVNSQYLKYRLQMHQGLLTSTQKIYEDTRKLFAISLGTVLAYLTNYILSFYLFTFAKLPSDTEAAMICFILLLLIYIFQQWFKKSVLAVRIEGPIKLSKTDPPQTTAAVESTRPDLK